MFLAAATPPDLQSLVVDLLQKVEAGVTKFAPTALKLILATIKVSSIFNLLLSGLAFLVVALLFKSVIKLSRSIDWVKGEFAISYVIVYALVCIIIGIWWMVTWLDVWVWVGAFYPELNLTHQIIQKVLDH